MNVKLYAVVLSAVWAGSIVSAEETSLELLKQQMQQLQQQMKQLQDKIAEAEIQPATSPEKSTRSYLNISAVGDIVIGTSTEEDVESLNGAHHDPGRRGFNLTGLEVTLDGAVDPYFKALATLTLVISPEGETEIELEEAWMQTISLPANLQLRAGQFLADFGRQNTQHNHTWAFVDQPVAVTRLMGPDGLRNPGARVSWLAPWPVYTELMLSVFDSSGETAFSFRSEESSEIHGGRVKDTGLHSLNDLLYVPRLVTAFDIHDTQTLLLGASGAFGPNNSGSGADTQIYGGDVYWKWKPRNARAGFPFVGWQTEVIYRRYEAAARPAEDGSGPLPAETLRDWGLYSQLLWGFTRGWVAGIRGEYANGDEASFDSDWRGERCRLAPNATWYPTEFSKLRLQYNYDHRCGIGSDHSVWFQLEFLLGAHAAHKF